jgi:hypothetical protein
VFIRDGHVVLTGAPAASLAQPYKAEWALSHMADFDSAFPPSGQRLHAGVQTTPEVSLSGTPVSDAAHSRLGATVMVVPDGVERPRYSDAFSLISCSAGAWGEPYFLAGITPPAAWRRSKS